MQGKMPRKKIHARKKVKKKIHAEGRSNCDFFTRSKKKFVQRGSPEKKNSCTSSERKKKFVQAENSPPPPPITFLMVRPYRIFWVWSKMLGHNLFDFWSMIFCRFRFFVWECQGDKNVSLWEGGVGSVKLKSGFGWCSDWYGFEQKRMMSNKRMSFKRLNYCESLDLCMFYIYNKKKLDNRKFIHKIKKELINRVSRFKVFVEDVRLQYNIDGYNYDAFEVVGGGSLKIEDIFSSKKIFRDFYDRCESNHEFVIDKWRGYCGVTGPFVYSQYKLKYVRVIIHFHKMFRKVFQVRYKCLNELIHEVCRRRHKRVFLDQIWEDMMSVAWYPSRFV